MTIQYMKRGQYADLPAAQISELIQSNSLDVKSLASHPITLNTYSSRPFRNDKPLFFQKAPTQSLLSVVNGILDESIERKRGEIPHVCLLLMTLD